MKREFDKNVEMYTMIWGNTYMKMSENILIVITIDISDC